MGTPFPRTKPLGLKRYKQALLNLYEKIVSDEVYISLSLLVLLVIAVVVPTAIHGFYGKPDFMKSIWANINAMVIDLLIVGFFVKILSRVGSRRRTIQQYVNEIDDLRGWEDQMAAHRIRGNIVRLNRLGISKINLRSCYLAKADLAGVNLNGADLIKASLEDCDLDDSNLQETDFWSANLKGATLRNVNLCHANLRNCVLTNADLSGADLRNVCLKDSVLLDADLTGTILDNADLSGVTDLGPIQLTKAKSAKNITIEERLINIARRIRPELFDKAGPKDEPTFPR